MFDKDKTKEQLLEEVINYRRRILTLEKVYEEYVTTKDKLLTSEEKYRLLVESLQEGIWALDKEENTSFVNDRMAEMLGYTVEEMIGKKVFDFMDERGVRLCKEKLEQRKAGGKEQHDFELIKKDGSVLSVLMEASPIIDDDGNYIGGIAGVIDITERKRIDEIMVSRLHLMQFAEKHSLDELLEETLNQAEKLTGSYIGFYHFVENDQKSLTLQNWSTRTKSEFCKAEGKGSHYSIDNAGVWVDCVYQRKPVIHNDYVSLPNRKGMPLGHAEVIREMVVPVLRGEKIRAILGVGNKPSAYSEKDIEVVSLLADLAWDIAEHKLSEEEKGKLINELKDALAKVKQLSGMLPICTTCKKIRDDNGYWDQVESYITKHTDTLFSHGMCPECAKKAYVDFEKFKKDNN